MLSGEMEHKVTKDKYFQVYIVELGEVHCLLKCHSNLTTGCMHFEDLSVTFLCKILHTHAVPVKRNMRVTIKELRTCK